MSPQPFPESCLRKSPWRVFEAVALSSSLIAAGTAFAAWAPAWLLPLTWLVSGLGLFGFMVLAHDAGHGNLFATPSLNHVAGSFLSLPIAQPYVPMVVLHSRHHRFLNHVTRDPTWMPWSPETYRSRPPLARAVYRAVRGGFWWFGTVFNLTIFHFAPRELPADRRAAGVASMLLTAAFTAAVTAAVAAAAGVGAVVAYLVGPWLVFNAIYSTMTYLQHTHEGARWHDGADAPSFAEATVHLRLPPPLARAVHYINYHVPHHMNARIPFHNLPAAHAWIEAQGMQPLSVALGLGAVRAVIERCHLYDIATHRFVTFKEASRR